MPKKAVAIFLLLGLVGAALYIYFTFPRSADQIPKSNNQRPYPSAPGPNGVPLPESVPHPNTPKLPPGASLRVMAWASAAETPALQAEADAFAAQTGNIPSLQIDGDEASYRRDLREAFASDIPPDVCLIAARDFSGIDPGELAPVPRPTGISPRSIAAFTAGDAVHAVPDEFSVDMLFYNARYFDQAGIAYPDRHWTWDIMEAITRALTSLNLRDEQGRAIYALELPADFDFWNILCTQAGHPALERNQWHLADSESRDSHLRGLDLIYEFFHELNVAAPPDRAGSAPGEYFSQQRAAILIAPSELAAMLPDFRHGMTLLPSDLQRASLARVNGWAVSVRSSQIQSAQILAAYLARQPVHQGWTSVNLPADDAAPENLCHEALEQSLLPRLEPKTERLAALLDEQIGSFASGDGANKPENLYAQIQLEYQAGYAPPVRAALPLHAAPKADVRGL